MNVGLLMDVELDDAEASEMFAQFCAANTDTFKLAGIRRITFILFYKQQFPRYFTYR